MVAHRYWCCAGHLWWICSLVWCLWRNHYPLWPTRIGYNFHRNNGNRVRVGLFLDFVVRPAKPGASISFPSFDPQHEINLYHVSVAEWHYAYNCHFSMCAIYYLPIHWISFFLNYTVLTHSLVRQLQQPRDSDTLARQWHKICRKLCSSCRYPFSVMPPREVVMTSVAKE